MSSRQSLIHTLNLAASRGSFVTLCRRAAAAIGHGLCRVAAERNGITAVEFGLAAPVLLGILSPVIDLGLAFSQQMKVRHAAEAGAQYASLNPWSNGTASAIQNAVNNATALSLAWSQTPNEFCGCPNSTNTQIANTGTPPCSGTPSGCSEPAGYYVTFTVTSNYKPLMPFSILSNPTTLSAQPVVRVQ
jgi:Flp pilus assembly protein TadG